jgi:hypothetical protein
MGLRISGGTEFKAWVKIRHLEAFNSLRLFIVVAIEISAEILIEVAAEVLAEVLIELAGGTKLKARVKMRQPEELEVFDSPRLSIVVTTEVTTEVASEVAAEVIAEAVAIVLLMAVRY